MKRWEITALEGTKPTIDADDVQLTPSGVAIFITISETLKDKDGKAIAEICGLAGNTFKVIKPGPMPLVDVSQVIHINSNSIDDSI